MRYKISKIEPEYIETLQLMFGGYPCLHQLNMEEIFENIVDKDEISLI
ncbi:CLUMA_CG020218, isoform A [Clunio marinus]|uniref:CLUMA_CG020218, isoform A n=1 Tax=Clunio marinus TaxID=568069 RepID=A0A1J1J6Z0_9DIPT|nr:CLUMA_CG020218, isoform A [Clunio marinus]